MWIWHAEGSFKPGEICHSLAIEPGSTNFDVQDMPSIMIQISCRQGLIIVDKEASTVRLVHFTLREYHSANADIFTRPHLEMAKICLTYVSCEFPTGQGPFSRNLGRSLFPHRRQPFSALFFSLRGRSCEKGTLGSHHVTCPAAVYEYDGRISAEVFVDKVGNCLQDFYASPRWSGMHCAPFFGIVKIIAVLMEMGCYDLSEEDCFGCIAPSLAIEKGHEGVVKILPMQKDGNPDKPDNLGHHSPMPPYMGMRGW